MSYPHGELYEGEDVVLNVHPHWRVLVRPVAVVAVLAVLPLVTAESIDHDAPTYGAVALLSVGLVRFVVAYLRWVLTNFVVTTDRVLYRTGVLTKSSDEFTLDRVADSVVVRTLFDRLVGAGDLLLDVGGEWSRRRFPNLRRPNAVREIVIRERERMRMREADRQAGLREPSIPEQLEKLDDLRRRGIVTQAEFDAKKAQLLDRM